MITKLIISIHKLIKGEVKTKRREWRDENSFIEGSCFMGGCMGKPMEPPYCNKCFEELLNRGSEPNDVNG